MKIAYIYHSAHVDVCDILKMSSPKDYSYGAFDLRDIGDEVDLFEIKLWEPSFTPKKHEMYFSKFISPLLLNKKVPDQYIIEALRLSKILNNGNYDVVMCLPLKMTLALACCKFFGKLNCEVVGLLTGFLNVPDNWFHKIIYNKLFSAIHLVSLGYGEFLEMKNRYMLNEEKVHLIPFGVDEDFWKPKKHERKEQMILSVGNDHYRDFELLLEVASKIPVQFVIVTRRIIEGKLPSNVQIIKGSTGKPALSFIELRDLYRSATCVLTPIQDTFQPSGQSSTLQAMACGVPVVIANFRGVWSTSQLKHRKNVLLYKVGDSVSCCEAIQLLLLDEQFGLDMAQTARDMVENQASSKNFALSLRKVFSLITGK